MLTVSHAPTINRQRSENGKKVEKPNRIVKQLKKKTATSKIMPGCLKRLGLSQAIIRLVITAPTESAAESRPKPISPECSTSVAKIGRRVREEAKKVAKKSSSMVETRILLPQTNCRPSTAAARLMRWVGRET